MNRETVDINRPINLPGVLQNYAGKYISTHARVCVCVCVAVNDTVQISSLSLWQLTLNEM